VNDAAIARTGGQILVDQLVAQGVERVYCVPGESYLAALDALYDAKIAVTVCRQETGAAIMALTDGRLTGRPGVCFVTRGPGATNAAHGVHIAEHDSAPLVLFVARSSAGCAAAALSRRWTIATSSARPPNGRPRSKTRRACRKSSSAPSTLRCKAARTGRRQPAGRRPHRNG